MRAGLGGEVFLDRPTRRRAEVRTAGKAISARTDPVYERTGFGAGWRARIKGVYGVTSASRWSRSATDVLRFSLALRYTSDHGKGQGE